MLPYFVESAIRFPSVGPLTWLVPTLKKSAVASSTTTWPNTVVAATMTGPALFGSRCRSTIRSDEAPAACAASMNSRSRRIAQLARTTRATVVHMYRLRTMPIRVAVSGEK